MPHTLASRPAPVAEERPTAPVRPAEGRITPAKLAGLSETFRVPVTRVEVIIKRSSAAVQRMAPQEVAQRLQELSEGLGIRLKQAAFMASKQPGYMLLTPLPDIHAKVEELATVLGVPPAAVLRTALTVPSILCRKTATVQRRVAAYSVLLRCTPLDVLHVLARGPEYLSDTPSSVRQRMIALGLVLGRPRCTIAAMLQARPDLVSMSGKVMNTKVNGLMSILNKEKRHIVTLIVKLPALLRCNLDRARAVFGGLQALLRKREGFVYAMICHAPQLLLLPPRGLHQRCSVLRRCLATSPHWVEQFQELRPPGVAQLLLDRRGSLSAMMFLVGRRTAGSASLDRLLEASPNGGPAGALGDSWPEFSEWMEWRRKVVATRAQQRRAAMIEVAQRSGMTGSDSRQAPRHSQERAHATPVSLLSRPPLPSRLPLSLPPHFSVGPPAPLHELAEVPQFVGVAALAAGALAASSTSLTQPAVGRSNNWTRERTEDGPTAGGGQAADAACSSTAEGHSKAHSSSSNGAGASSSGAGVQDPDSGAAAERGQQPGASSSGRQPTWLQLQAQYRRSLQSRARKKPPAAEGSPAGHPQAATGAAASARRVTAARREGASVSPREPGVNTAATPVAQPAVAASEQGTRATSPRPGRGRPGTGHGHSSNAAAAHAQQADVSTHGACSEPMQDPWPMSGGASAQVSTVPSAGDRTRPSGPATPAPPWPGAPGEGQVAQRQQVDSQHTLRTLLRSRRRPQQQPSEPLSSAESAASSSTSNRSGGGASQSEGGPNGAATTAGLGVNAQTNPVCNPLAEQVALAAAHVRPGDPSAAGGPSTSARLRDAQGVHNAAAPGTPVPLWLHLRQPVNGNRAQQGRRGSDAALGMPDHAAVASGTCSSAAHVQPDRDVARAIRSSASSSCPGLREDRECSTSVVVLSEDGEVQELTALDRERCKQGPQGRGLSRSSEHWEHTRTQALEHALGAMSPR